MKKEWFLKVVCVFGCIFGSLFLFTTHSYGQFPYNPYSYQQSSNPYVYQQSYNSPYYELVNQQSSNPYGYQQFYNSPYYELANDVAGNKYGDNQFNSPPYMYQQPYLYDNDFGPKGKKGDKGDQGIQGPKGDKGDKGDQGIQGLKGDQGLQGEQGLKGDKGDQGLQGEQGLKGDKGDQGVQGIQGEQGLKGDKGDLGIQGPKGDKGDTGDTGPQGDTGPTGPAGSQGLQGAQGPMGECDCPITLEQFNQLLEQFGQLTARIEKLEALNRFTDMGDGTIRDNNTGLIWLKNANCIGSEKWGNAMAAAADLSNGYCGLTDGSVAGDWRLPTKEEWEAFYSTVYDNPALVNTVGDAQWSEGDAFTGVQSDVYWTSTGIDSYYAWYVLMAYGDMSLRNKNHGLYVWPVRSDN